MDYLVTTWFRGEALLFDVQKRDLLIFLNFSKAQKKAIRPLWQSAEQNSQLKLRPRVHVGYSTQRYILKPECMQYKPLFAVSILLSKSKLAESSRASGGAIS